MSELDLIEGKIADTKAKIKKAEDEGMSEAYLTSLRTVLSEQTGVRQNILSMENDPLKNLVAFFESYGFVGKEAVEAAELELGRRRKHDRAAAPDLVDFLRARLAGMDTSPPPVVLSPTGGMQGQDDQPFGKTLYGITDVAKDVAKLADNTFANFAQKKVQPNKVYYVMGALLSGMGTGKSSFLDRHASLIREYCQNEALKKLLAPESRPLVLNVSFSSGSSYSADEGAGDEGAVSIARRLVYAYTKAPWNSIRAARADETCLCTVLEVIVGHHRRVCGMTDDQQMVVVLNVDEVNQIHTRLDQTSANERVYEVVDALRQLSMTGVTGAVGVGPAVLCLLAGTGTENFRRSMEGSSVEFITRSLPLLTSAEVVALVKECGVHEDYLSDPSFLQLMEDTGGVPRLLKKVLEGLTMHFAEDSIAKARNNALQYIKNSHSRALTAAERVALIPYIVLGVPAPHMADPLVKQSRTTRTFEDMHMKGAIFQDGEQLVMPVLQLEALFSGYNPGIESLVGRLIFWYHHRTREGFEMFTALFHALKMQHLSGQRVGEVSMGDFYRGALMPPRVAAMKIRLEDSAKYEVKGQPSDIRTYRFPGTDEAKNEEKVGLLKNGAILLNGKMAPAGGVILANPLGGGRQGVLVRSLRVAHTATDKMLDRKTIVDAHSKALKAFELHPQLFANVGAAEVVTVHVTIKELRKDAKTPQDGCIVISRDEIPKFFGPTFQRGLLSPTYAARAYYTTSRAGGSRLTCASGALRPVPALPSCTVAGLRLARNLVRRLL